MDIPSYFATKTMWEVTRASDIPAEKCYVIQFFGQSSIEHEEDERSRQTGGRHGYSAWTETINVSRMFVTRDKEEWQNAIQALYVAKKDRLDVAAYVLEKASIKTNVVVNIT